MTKTLETGQQEHLSLGLNLVGRVPQKKVIESCNNIISDGSYKNSSTSSNHFLENGSLKEKAPTFI